MTIDLVSPRESKYGSGWSDYKDEVRSFMLPKRLEAIRKSSDWIARNEPFALRHMAQGSDIRPDLINPYVEECTTEEQMTLWRYFRLMCTMPYSEYVGRRMRFLIRDASLPNHPIMGIAALGSSVMQVRDRDRWIGWESSDDKKTKAQMREIKKLKIGHLMDMYVSASVAPYNELISGKLICYVMVSNEVRNAYRSKYGDKTTIIRGNKIDRIVLIVTTTLYGARSSQYNRIKYNDGLLYLPIGETAGFGSTQVTNEQFNEMRRYLEENDIHIDYKFGSGGNWRMRVIKAFYEKNKMDSDGHLNHGFRKGLYVAPLIKNCREFLCGMMGEADIEEQDYPLESLISYWKARWLKPRSENNEVMARVEAFDKEEARLTRLLD